MKTGLAAPAGASDLPAAAEMAALRAWHEGVDTRTAVANYLPAALNRTRSARAVIGALRRQLVTAARRRHRPDLAAVLDRVGRDLALTPRQLQRAAESLAASPLPLPVLTDRVDAWLPPRVVRALHAAGIQTLTDLTVRIPRLKGWWRAIPDLGQAGARSVEALFAAYPRLTDQARQLIEFEAKELIPWERLALPAELDGSRGAFRAPRRDCVLEGRTDYDAVQAWLELQESDATRRAYRKEAERLILWAVIERGKALSSLTTEDAIAYRAFVRAPKPARRWIGPAQPRTSPQWRPFQGPLSARSAAYALSVVSALFRWLVDQRYLVANPFAGVRVKAGRTDASPTQRSLSQQDWSLIRAQADRAEALLGWSDAAADRLRFVLEFGYATGLRSGELVRAKLSHIRTDERGNHWIGVVGKGNKAGDVVVPPSAWRALSKYLRARELPVTPSLWGRDTPLIGRLNNAEEAFTGARLWAFTKRFFRRCADEVESRDRPLAAKLRSASPHWMRHSHASHALARGAALTTVRDNLRHASIATTTRYLHGDDDQRAREMSEAFGEARRSTGR